MSLLNQIEQDFLIAYKAKESEKVAVLRMLKAAFRNFQIDAGRDLQDEDVLALILKQAKQRKESIAQFGQAGREDLKEKEERELQILEAYLPQPLSPQEIETAIIEAIAATGADGPDDMGKVMKAVLFRYQGRVDGKSLSTLVRQHLTA